MTKEHIERLIEAHTELYDLIYMTACDWCEITHVGSKPDYYLEGCTVDFVNSDTVTLE